MDEVEELPPAVNEQGETADEYTARTQAPKKAGAERLMGLGIPEEDARAIVDYHGPLGDPIEPEEATST